ncbi:unnamed protein product, partial [marine sediment metagenome]
DNVIPLGILSDVGQYVAASDMFIAPLSSIRGIVDYPLTILQAMACGKPVVATTVGGIPEIIEHGQTGLLVQPNDGAGLAKAIMYLLADKDRAIRMGKRGAKYVPDRFSPAVVGDELEDILRGLCS